ncbi:hypothetical protein ATN79_48520 [Paraburkholderia caribensis]|nr:hypothetical protein ATN79_48520 [Paraburkholderia caribensis]
MIHRVGQQVFGRLRSTQLRLRSEEPHFYAKVVSDVNQQLAAKALINGGSSSWLQSRLREYSLKQRADHIDLRACQNSSWSNVCFRAQLVMHCISESSIVAEEL